MSPATFLNLGSVATYPARFTCASWIMFGPPCLRRTAATSTHSGPAAWNAPAPTTVTYGRQGGHEAAGACGQPCEKGGTCGRVIDGTIVSWEDPRARDPGEPLRGRPPTPWEDRAAPARMAPGPGAVRQRLRGWLRARSRQAAPAGMAPGLGAVRQRPVLMVPR